jgi:hypothetical protein
MWESFLYNIVHQVKTGFGPSKGGYNFSLGSPIYGPGQGSKGGPSSCSTMTSILIDSMPKLCNRLQFTSPDQQLQYTLRVDMFVDDASNCTNHFLEWLHEPPSLEEALKMIRHDSQTWERFLWTSGGLLNLSKCAFYILAWQLDSEGHATYIPKQAIPDLQLTSGNQPGLSKVKQLTTMKLTNTSAIDSRLACR